MRRFSIARLMFAIAFLGANFGVFRYLLRDPLPHRRDRDIALGFVPFLDCLLIGLYLLVRKFRLNIHRRALRVGFLPSFVVASFLVSAVLVGIYFLADDLIDDYGTIAGRVVMPPLRAMGFSAGLTSPYERAILVPFLLGVILSGPPLLVSLALGAALSTFKLVITPRVAEEPPGVDSTSLA